MGEAINQKTCNDENVLAVFSDLAQCLLAGEVLPRFSREVLDDNILVLWNESIKISFLPHDIWLNESLAQPFWDQAQRAEHGVVCVGENETFNDNVHLDDRLGVLKLVLPMTVGQMLHNVKNFISQQERLLTAEKTKLDIQKTSDSVKYVMQISRALNGIRDTDKLLTLILQKAREVTRADAGSIYVVKWHHEEKLDGIIRFKITQNESVEQNLNEFEMPISDHSIVGSSVIHQTTINIADLYELDPSPENNPFRARHDKTWDDRIGYQCRSMLTMPIFDISHRVIGVIQLINSKSEPSKQLTEATDFDTYVQPFDHTSVEYAEIVAHQAGIALENAMLTEEKEELFEGFVHASVTAIEQRDPTTSGHSHRVATLTLGMARLVNRTRSGRLGRMFFSEDELKEIEYASLLHDFGKLGVREQVLVKSKKLYPWEETVLRERFEHIRTIYKCQFQQQVIHFLTKPQDYPPETTIQTFEEKQAQRILELERYLEFILAANEPTVLEQGGFEKLKDIANLTFTNTSGMEVAFLSDQELKALSVSRGSLTRAEFAEIQSHVVHTYEFLRKIPWGSKFRNLPQIAAKHHEKLDGSGYPNASVGNEIPVQSRMMTIADIFDALTAADRPYKKAVPTDRALDIIEMEVKAGRCDKELFELFTSSKIFETVLDKRSVS